MYTRYAYVAYMRFGYADGVYNTYVPPIQPSTFCTANAGSDWVLRTVANRPKPAKMQRLECWKPSMSRVWETLNAEGRSVEAGLWDGVERVVHTLGLPCVNRAGFAVYKRSL